MSTQSIGPPVVTKYVWVAKPPLDYSEWKQLYGETISVISVIESTE